MDDVQIMGTAEEYVTMLGAASSPHDVMCAEQVKGRFFGAAGCTVGTIGLGLFGVYKLFKGKPAAGVTGLIASVLTLGVGRVLAQSAATQFEACRTSGGVDASAAGSAYAARLASDPVYAARYHSYMARFPTALPIQADEYARGTGP